MPLKTSTNLSGVTLRLVNARPPGRMKLAKAPPTRLTGRANALKMAWWGEWEGSGRGRAQLELTDV